jgi:pilus assembly protein TadC
MTWAALLLAAAVLLGGTSRRPVTSRRHPVSGARADDSDDPLAMASSLDILAACLSSGMTVAGAASAAAWSAPRPLAEVLSRAADLLAMGADPARAWADPTTDHVAIAALVRLARRSAASGTALAQGVTELAEQARHDAADAATGASERASVLIAGPLGLCYLPAFLCLGIVPVVVGLAGDVLTTGVL